MNIYNTGVLKRAYSEPSRRRVTRMRETGSKLKPAKGGLKMKGRGGGRTVQSLGQTGRLQALGEEGKFGSRVVFPLNLDSCQKRI